jgi:hypothetical protein
MNKYQEALNSAVNRWAPASAWAILKELVDKATPEKPIHKANGRIVCPKCYRTTASAVSPVYCCLCGQRLDWSEE